MGKVIIQKETTKNPVELIGEESGICYGSDVTDKAKNFFRGLDCIESNHGRTLEFPQVYMILEGYSAKVMREFYTHIGGDPTRLQASTRYIDYEHGFEYVTPLSIAYNEDAKFEYESAMDMIATTMTNLANLGIPKEDASMLLPLGMQTKVVVRTNLRALIDMSRQRMCHRAFWEYRMLMEDILAALADYSPDWNTLVNNVKVFKPKCEALGYCPERKGCGKMPGRNGERKK